MGAGAASLRDLLLAMGAGFGLSSGPDGGPTSRVWFAQARTLGAQTPLREVPIPWIKARPFGLAASLFEQRYSDQGEQPGTHQYQGRRLWSGCDIVVGRSGCTYYARP